MALGTLALCPWARLGTLGHAGKLGTAKDDRPIEERIFDRLELEPRTKTWLASHLGKGKPEIDDGLTNLFAARRIQSTTITVKGRSFKAFEPAANTVRTPFGGSAE